MQQLDGKTVLILILAAVLLYALFGRKSGSKFTLEGAPIDGAEEDEAPATAPTNGNGVPKQMKTTGAESEQEATVTQDSVSGAAPSALLPKEIPTKDDFGKFSADQILSGQNYLDPRAQIGYPETVGGVLRNANLQIRSEPANPRDPVSIWNLSTISPDEMRPLFEIDKEYA